VGPIFNGRQTYLTHRANTPEPKIKKLGLFKTFYYLTSSCLRLRKCEVTQLGITNVTVSVPYFVPLATVQLTDKPLPLPEPCILLRIFLSNFSYGTIPVFV
jgi:hypothetical protein